MVHSRVNSCYVTPLVDSLMTENDNHEQNHTLPDACDPGYLEDWKLDLGHPFGNLTLAETGFENIEVLAC